jgi:HK97 family phage major capsid protein
MKSSHQIRAELQALVANAEAMQELATIENREFNAEETAEIDALATQREVLNQQLDTAIKREAIVASKLQPVLDDRRQDKPKNDDPRKTVPIRFAKVETPKNFESLDDAYRSGQYILAVAGNKKARNWCKENYPVRAAHTTGDNTKGGFLVPEPLEAAIIAYRQQYGVFSRMAQQWTMTDGVQNVPKLTGEMTAYYVGENTTITASDMSFGMVRLEAKKLAGVGVISSELNEDAVLSVADAYAQSVAQKFSYEEDNAGFNGDGTSTYGGIVGASGALAAGSVVTASGHTTVSALTLADFEAAVGELPEYPGMAPAWFFHKKVWAGGPQRLLDAVGGVTMGEVAMGAPKQLLGYPVIFTQVLSSAPTTGLNYGYFGDLRFAAIMGRRRGMTMKVDSSIYVLQDALALIATQRYDINVHDRGDASNAGSLLNLKLG